MTNVTAVELVLITAKTGDKVSRTTLRSALLELGFQAHSMVKHEDFDGNVCATRKWQTTSEDFPFRVPIGEWDSPMISVEKTKQAADFFDRITGGVPQEALAS